VANQVLTTDNMRQAQPTGRGQDRIRWNVGHPASPEMTAHYQSEPTKAVVFPDAPGWAMQNGVSITVYINPDDPYEPVELPESFAAVFESQRQIERGLGIKAKQGVRLISV
jgi:hypothetical protein